MFNFNVFKRKHAPAATAPVMLRGGQTVHVVGEARYQRELETIAGPKRKEGVSFECIACLLPEPENPYDANAIMVTIDGRRVGYLSRGDAKVYGPVLARLAGSGVTQCHATITGGWKRGDDEGHFGVMLGLAAPEELSQR